MAATDYTVNILMNMRDNLSRAAESAARALDKLGDESITAADALEQVADITGDIADNLEDLGGSTADAADGVGDLASASADAGDSIDDLADPVATAADEIENMFDAAYESVDALEETAEAAQDAGVELQDTGTEAEKAAEALERTGEGAGQAEKELSTLKDTLKAAAVAMAAIKLGEKAMEFVALGAQVQETKDRFYAFSGSAAVGAENLRLFREATKGTVDDISAMEVMTKLLGMGLVDNAAQMSQVAQIAVNLGDQHRDAGDRIMDFAQMLATGSTRRLFEYGISVADVETKAKELQATYQSMSKDEAFKLAVLSVGQAQLEKLGVAGLSADDKLDRVQAGFANLKNEAALAALSIAEASGALDAMSEKIPQLSTSVSQFTTLAQIMSAIPLAATMQKIAFTINPVILSFRLLGEVIKGVGWVVGELATGLVKLAAMNEGLRVAMYNALPAEMRTNEELNRLSAQAATAKDKVNDLSTSINNVPKKTKLSIFVDFVKSKLGIGGLQLGGIASGLTMVGERGAEAVQLPAGSRVYSHEQTQNINNYFNQTVNTRATSGTVAMDFQMLRSLAT